jgi:rare lipoprotein A
MKSRQFIKLVSTVAVAACLSLSNFAEGNEIGIASFYSTKTGTKTASGIKLKDNEYTAAHRTLKFGTKVKVTNLRNKKSIVVTITDRGPFIKGRIIDVTRAGAKALGFYERGLDTVKIEVVKG